MATLPVGNNVALATGLLVNWPAAVGVYVASKLFSNQVDKVASVSYSMTGSWDDPKMEFERLFDSKAAKDAGEKVAEEVEHKEAQVEAQLLPQQEPQRSSQQEPQQSSQQEPQRSSQQEAAAETPKQSQEQIPATESQNNYAQ